MAIVYSTLDPNHVLTAKEKREIAALKHRPIIIDEDCPEMSVEEMLAAIEYTKKHKLLEKGGLGVMATVSKTIDVARELTEEELARFEALKNRPIIVDDDCPELTDEEIAEGLKTARANRYSDKWFGVRSKIASFL